MQPQFVKASKMKIGIKTFSTAEAKTDVADMLQNRCS